MRLAIELHVTGGAADRELDEEVRGMQDVTIAHAAHAPAEALTQAAWRDDGFNFWQFDRHLDDLVACGEPLRVAAPGGDAAAVLREIAIRAQRVRPQRNRATGAWFDRVLAEHRALHDVTRPLVRADLDHAIDAWQWTLRLDPEAPARVQLAVLLHDIERLASEPDVRVEHRAPDYQAFKDAHAVAGAAIARGVLERAGVEGRDADDVAQLIAAHERPSDDAAVRAVNDADALSFFSFNSPGYLAYFGPAQTAVKIAYTLARMSDAALRHLAGVRMLRGIRAEIDRWLHVGHLDQRA